MARSGGAVAVEQCDLPYRRFSSHHASHRPCGSRAIALRKVVDGSRGKHRSRETRPERRLGHTDARDSEIQGNCSAHRNSKQWSTGSDQQAAFGRGIPGQPRKRVHRILRLGHVLRECAVLSQLLRRDDSAAHGDEGELGGVLYIELALDRLPGIRDGLGSQAHPCGNLGRLEP